MGLELWREVWGRLGGTRALTARSLGEESFWEKTTTQEKMAQGRALVNTRSSVRGTSQRWDVLVKDRVALQRSIPPAVWPREVGAHAHRSLCTNVHSSIICKNQTGNNPQVRQRMSGETQCGLHTQRTRIQPQERRKL